MKACGYSFLFVVVFGFLRSFAQPVNLADLQAGVAKDDPRAEYNLGRAYHLGSEGVPRDFSKAADLYRKAAAHGNTHAMYNLGYMYHYAQGVPRDDAAAEQWFQKAAEGGLPSAQLQVGLSYCNGENGLKQDYKTAAKWLLLAAQPSSPPSVSGSAANGLAFLFEHGYGIAQNNTQALFWYTQAAEAGYGKAMGNLGRLYEEGDIVKKDPVQAYMWLKLGAFQGDEMARHLISDYLASHLFTDEQKAAGDHLVAEYRSRHHQAPLAGAIPTVVTPGMMELAKAKADADAAKGAPSAAGSVPAPAASSSANSPPGVNAAGH